MIYTFPAGCGPVEVPVVTHCVHQGERWGPRHFRSIRRCDSWIQILLFLRCERLITPVLSWLDVCCTTMLTVTGQVFHHVVHETLVEFVSR